MTVGDLTNAQAPRTSLRGINDVPSQQRRVAGDQFSARLTS